MPLTKEQIRTITDNHIPTVKKATFLFLDSISFEPEDEAKQIDYLLDLIDVMEAQLANTKTILEGV